VRGIFETQLRMELEARDYYATAANDCQEAGDLGSFALFMRILKDEEEHIDFVEEQVDLLELMGDQLYVARQVSSVTRTTTHSHPVLRRSVRLDTQLSFA
jgi:bacterioferritin